MFSLTRRPTMGGYGIVSGLWHWVCQMKYLVFVASSMFISPIRKKGLYSNGEIDRPASIVDWAQPSPRICPGITGLPASLKSWMEDLEWLEHQPLRSKVSVGFSLGLMMFWYVLHVSYRIKHWEGFLELVQSMSGNLKTFVFLFGGFESHTDEDFG